MSYLHDRGVKGFVALNVLVFDSELPQLEDRARKLAEAGVDAVIVQVGASGLTQREYVLAGGVLVFGGQLEDRARKQAEAGVDAVIVQLGACVLRKDVCISRGVLVFDSELPQLETLTMICVSLHAGLGCGGAASSRSPLPAGARQHADVHHQR